MTTEKEHVFETAGLGKAPFTFVGMYVSRGPIRTELNGVVCEVGYAGQPMGTCEYCGNGIANCFQIKSADGKSFIVGSECVMKTGDNGLRAKVNEVKTAIQHEKDDTFILEGMKWVEDNAEALKLTKHGKYTLYDSLLWYKKNAGRSGMIRILKFARKAIA